MSPINDLVCPRFGRTAGALATGCLRSSCVSCPAARWCMRSCAGGSGCRGERAPAVDHDLVEQAGACRHGADARLLLDAAPAPRPRGARSAHRGASWADGHLRVRRSPVCLFIGGSPGGDGAQAVGHRRGAASYGAGASRVGAVRALARRPGWADITAPTGPTPSRNWPPVVLCFRLACTA